jgi:hypothetical protein
VRRQQERDVAVLLPAIQALTERQHQLFFLFLAVILKHKPEGFIRLIDEDVAEAAGAMAGTFETAARGVIYEHVAQTVTAGRLLAELKSLVTEIRQDAGQVQDREIAGVLRAIEKGARETRAITQGRDTAYLELVARILHQGPAAPNPAGPADSPRLIV